MRRSSNAFGRGLGYVGDTEEFKSGNNKDKTPRGYDATFTGNKRNDVKFGRL